MSLKRFLRRYDLLLVAGLTTVVSMPLGGVLGAGVATLSYESDERLFHLVSLSNAAIQRESEVQKFVMGALCSTEENAGERKAAVAATLPVTITDEPGG